MARQPSLRAAAVFKIMHPAAVAAGFPVLAGPFADFLRKSLDFCLFGWYHIRYCTAIKGGGTMPNIKSQKKRVITNAKDTERNKAVKSNLKTALKKAEAAIASGTEDKAAVVATAESAIDKALVKGVLSKNSANRKKSHIAKRANA